MRIVHERYVNYKVGIDDTKMDKKQVNITFGIYMKNGDTNIEKKHGTPISINLA